MLTRLRGRAANILKHIVTQDLLIVTICFQFEVFYGTADFTKLTEAPQNIWDKTWYVVEGFTYAAFASYFALRKSAWNYVVAWSMLAVFLLIRAIWEIYAVRHGWDVNMKIAAAILFTLISFICFIIIVLPYLKKIWQLLQRLGKWLLHFVR